MRRNYLTDQELSRLRTSLEREGHEVANGFSKKLLEKAFSTDAADQVIAMIDARLGIDCRDYQVTVGLFPQCVPIETEDFTGMRLSEVIQNAAEEYRYYRCGGGRMDLAENAIEEVVMALTTLGHSHVAEQAKSEILKAVEKELALHTRYRGARQWSL